MDHNTPDQPDRRIADLWILAIVAVLFAGPYFVFPAGWFGDDSFLLFYAQQNVHSSASDVFLYKDASMQRYRPLMQALATFGYRHFGFNSFPIRAASYLAFLTTLATLYALMRRLTQSRYAPLFSLICFAALPIKTQALFRPGRPEMFVAAFSLLSVFCLQKGGWALHGRYEVRNRSAWLTGSLFFAIGAALWSELGISVFLVVALWIIAPRFIDRRGLDTSNQPLLYATIQKLSLPIVGIAIYLGWYCFVGAPLSASAADARYQFHLGWNVLGNTILAFAGLLSPISSPTIVRIVHGFAGIQDWLIVVLGLISSGLLAVLVGTCIGGARRSLQIAAVFLGSAMLSLVPFIFVGHITEFYLVQAAAFISGCAGVLAGTAFEKMSRLRSRLFSAASITLVAVMLFSSLGAFLLLRHNARVFATLYAELVRHRYLDGVEQVVLVPPRTSIAFSEYYLPYNMILFGQYADLPKVEWLSDWRAVPDTNAEPGTVYQVDINGRTMPYPLH